MPLNPIAPNKAVVTLWKYQVIAKFNKACKTFFKIKWSTSTQFQMAWKTYALTTSRRSVGRL